MRFKNILLTTDFSPLSTECFSVVQQEANSGSAKVTILSVVSDWVVPPSMFEEIPLPERIDEYRKSVYEAAVKKMKTLVSGHFPKRTVAGDVVLSVRSDAEEICDYAKKNGCDLIVMASHGRGAVASIVIGSTTQRVLSQSICPVLVVPVKSRSLK